MYVNVYIYIWTFTCKRRPESGCACLICAEIVVETERLLATQDGQLARLMAEHDREVRPQLGRVHVKGFRERERERVREREGEKRGHTRPSRCTFPYSVLYRGMQSRGGGDRMNQTHNSSGAGGEGGRAARARKNSGPPEPSGGHAFPGGG